MAQENVEAFKRFIAAFNRLDPEAMLAEVDAEVEWRPAFCGVVFRCKDAKATEIRSHLDPSRPSKPPAFRSRRSKQSKPWRQQDAFEA